VLFSQEKEQVSPFTAVDSLYREDQFYFAVTYNSLQKTPAGFSQTGFSTGVNLGFLRDMPINKSRTFAIAAGLGISYNNYRQNVVVMQNNGVTTYQIVGQNSFSKNKLEQVFAELPIEIRWRNSTPESHRFWRIYTGFKISYLIYDKTKFVGNETIIITSNSDFNKIQYGPMISFGFNTWNLHGYYGLNPLFKSATIEDKRVDMRTLNLGLIFYIL
jgi:hypothetical protein